jgi:amino acid transporter
MLVILSAMFFHFRSSNPLNIPDSEWTYSSAGDVILPKSFVGVLFQASVAILILVGFDSATSMSGDAINASRDVPRACILSIVIQGCFAYLLEYWAANAALSNALTGDSDGDIVRGMDAAAASSAPIGDLAIQVVDAFGGNGKAFMIILAITVAMAVFGSTLAAMNTAVRFTQAMAEDGEMPAMFAAKSVNDTPLYGIAVQVVWTFIVGTVGAVGGTMTLTAVTLASNIGTFFLYGAVCVTTVVAFKNTAEEKTFVQVVMPIIGLTLNALMVCSIFIIGLMSGGDTTTATIIAIVLALVWTCAIVPYWKMYGGEAREIDINMKKVVPAPEVS